MSAKSGESSCWRVDNESNAAEHIWDRSDAYGFMGATATIVIPAYIDYYESTGDWTRRDLDNFAGSHRSSYVHVPLLARAESAQPS